MRAVAIVSLLSRAGAIGLGKAVSRIHSNRLAMVIEAIPATAPVLEARLGITVRREPSVGLVEIRQAMQRARGDDFLNLRALERMRQWDPGDAFVARLAHGQIVASIFVHDQVARDRLEQSAPGIYPPISAGDAFTEGLYCWPEFRGMGASSALLVETLRLIATSGIVRALAVVDVSNVRSLRAFARAGYVPSGVLRRGGFRLNRWRSEFVHDGATAQRIWLGIQGARS